MIIVLSAGRDSPEELRRRLAMDESAQREVLSRSHPGIGELALLCTCHRTEVYATADGSEADAIHALAAMLPGLRPTDQHDVRVMTGLDAVRHLYRVACGLDSLVVGEPQVLGQVRRALKLSQDEGAAGPMLTNIFGRAIRVGRLARQETALGALGQSIGILAADYIDQRLGSGAKRAAVVGAGEAAADAAAALRKKGADLAIVSRSIASARRLAADHDGQAFVLDQLQEVLASCDVVVAAIQGGVAVRPEHFPARRVDDPFLAIDLSVPPAIDAGTRTDVEVRSLEAIPGPRGPQVQAALIEAESIVVREVGALERWADTRESGPVIRDLRASVERMVRDELARASSGAEFSAAQVERMETMAMRIANKLLHGPVTELRSADEQTRELVRRMFDL